ncbi:MAG: hypothetical protein Q9162_005415 [Coniocarpon cinnabarinum]
MLTLTQSNDYLVDPQRPYVYTVLPLSLHDSPIQRFAITTSLSTLYVVKASGGAYSLSAPPHTNIHNSVTSLADFGARGASSSRFLTAGRDGRVRWWYFYHDDAEVNESRIFRTPAGQPISALAASAASGLIVAGTEHQDEGLGNVSVFVWDISSTQDTPIRNYSQSHSDTITCLAFIPPIQRNGEITERFLSASTDGLVQVFDVNEADEDEAVSVTVNTGGPVNHVLPVVVFGQGVGVWSMSQDERLGFDWLEDEATGGIEGIDVREALSVDYTIGLRPVGTRDEHGGVVVLAGRNKTEEGAPCIVAAKFGRGQEAVQSELMLRLEGGHGEEVIRDLWVNDAVWEGEFEGLAAVSVGEDGMVKLWSTHDETGVRQGEDVNMGDIEERNDDEGVASREKKHKKDKVAKGDRFAPY